MPLGLIASKDFSVDQLWHWHLPHKDTPVLFHCSGNCDSYSRIPKSIYVSGCSTVDQKHQEPIHRSLDHYHAAKSYILYRCHR